MGKGVQMRDLQDRIDYDRQVATQSTYWSCTCGFDHVPGCKAGRTTRIFIGGVVLAAVVSVWCMVN